ncbi:MAG: DUF6544 family protein [Actinomycetota bacterium]
MTTRPGIGDVPPPEPVLRAARRAVPPGTPVPALVRIRQEGVMRMRPGSRPLAFTATQDLHVGHVAFRWRARFPILGPLALRVVDGYAHGDGQLRVSVLGVPVQRRGGRDVAVGEALRYLAELPWVPFAMLGNPELAWSAVDADRAAVTATAAGVPARAVVEVDGTGDVVRVSCDDRPRLAGRSAVPTPWTGELLDHRTLGGIRVPTRAEVRWDLPDGPFPYWSATVTSLELIGPPPPPHGGRPYRPAPGGSTIP